jgi:hypothetical protein
MIYNKNVFDIKMESMLKDKPNRYKEIIKAKINRHIEYLESVGANFYEGTLCLNVLAQYMVELDSQYVSNREDNE